MKKNNRRFDLDWWRVIAIFAVYLHHVGMPFNGDGFHIMNSESSKLLDDVMVYFEQFRLPLLFLVSGVGTVFAFSKRNWRQFIQERAYRLLIPLAFGVLVIVPPQTFFENRTDHGSYWSFYRNVFSHIEVNHLWFIENLFYISVMAVPLILFLRSDRSASLKTSLGKLAAKRVGLVVWSIPLMIIHVVAKNYYPSDSKSLSNLSSTLFYGFFFVAGILMAVAPGIWIALKKYRRPHLYGSILVSLLFYAYYLLPSDIAANYLSLSTRWAIWYGISGLLSWLLLLTALGYGQVWLDRPSRILGRLNEAIYPFYILHQTVIVVFAYYIVGLDLGIGPKMILLLLSTFTVTVLIYLLLVAPFKWTRVVFGMKEKPREIPRQGKRYGAQRSGQ
jgi:peptidoglycan/LPS O-acetylase OafA/YrhL